MFINIMLISVTRISEWKWIELNSLGYNACEDDFGSTRAVRCELKPGVGLESAQQKKKKKNTIQLANI